MKRNILAEDFVSEQVFTFGIEPDAVDILTFSKGVSIDDIFRNATTARIDELKVKVIDIKDLLKNKKALTDRQKKIL